MLALTNDDETNLAVTMAAALLRPELPVIARTVSRPIAERMHAFGTPSVVNPFDRFGDHLRLALNAPASYQLLTWLEAGPGARAAGARPAAADGRWVMCGYGRFGRELTADLRAPGPRGDDHRAGTGRRATTGAGVIVGDASRTRACWPRPTCASAVGLVAGTDNDTTNLSMLATARRMNPKLFLAARQNQPTSAALFEAMQVDALLVPTEVVAHEVYAQISTPMLWRFIQGDARAGRRVGGRPAPAAAGQLRPRAARAVEGQAGRGPGAGAAGGWLADGGSSLGDLLRSPEERDRRLKVVPLLVLRGGDDVLTPDDETVLAADDELLFAGQGSERRELEGTMVVDSTAAYVLFDQHIPSSWVWRKLSRKNRTREHARRPQRRDQQPCLARRLCFSSERHPPLAVR